MHSTGALLLAGLLLALTPFALRLYWSVRSSNPVRRGVALIRDLGCFSCHGELGREGLRDPGGVGLSVPTWSGSVWMMYVKNDEDIRQFILDGVSRRRAASRSAQAVRKELAILMPAYRDQVNDREVDDLIAAFRVLSGMSRPQADTPEARGHELARSWSCFACHGPGASGGLPNPGSLTGVVPGWYGADFSDLARSRDEFDTWIREGEIPRLASNPVASYFVRKQRLQMPSYRNMTGEDLDALWAYAMWLDRTEGGVRPVGP